MDIFNIFNSKHIKMPLEDWIFRSKIPHDSATKYAADSGAKFSSIPLERGSSSLLVNYADLRARIVECEIL